MVRTGPRSVPKRNTTRPSSPSAKEPTGCRVLPRGEAHYIGDVSQYGHSVPFEAHHSAYERFVATRTASFGAAEFQSFIVLDSLVRRSAEQGGRVSSLH